MASEDSYDVIVLGSGLAGMAAALSASAAGLKVVLLEKATRLGGGTAGSYGLIWIGNNHLAISAGLSDNRDDVVRYMNFLGGGELHEQRMMALVDTAPVALRFFADCGARFQLVSGISDHYFGIAPGAVQGGRILEAELISARELGPWASQVPLPDESLDYVTVAEQAAWGGPQNFSKWDQDIVAGRKRDDVRGKGLGLICQFLKCLVARNVEIRTGASAASLRFERARVTGVITTSGETITALKGVVIATGGYEANPDLVRDFEGNLPGIQCQVPPTVTGDGMIMAAELGAAIRKIQNSLAITLAYAVPSNDLGKPPRLMPAGIAELYSPHTMVVNKVGERFADESFFQSMVPALKDFDTQSHQYRNLPCFLIFDQQYADRFSFAMRVAGAAIPDFVPRANDLVALGRAIGVNGGRLQQSADRYNSFVEAGVDEDFHRGETECKLVKLEDGGNPTLGSIAKPPFYGVSLALAVSSTTGLVTNEHAQVIHNKRTPITGLYASGIAAARTDVGAGYQAGLNLASAMTFSYRAIQHIRGLA